MATLLGPDGRPISVSARDLEEEISGPTLSGARSIFTDYPSRRITPERLSRILTEADQGDATAYLELAEEMEEKDLHYAAVLGTRKRAVAQLPVHVDPASEDKRDREIAEAVERDVFDRDEFQDELIDLLDAIGKGYAVAEIVWVKGKTWRPGRIVSRDPRWFRWDHETQQRLQLETEEGPVDLEPARFVTHVAKAKSGLPIRGGLARPVSWFWMFRTYGVKDWLVFLERFGMPTRVGKYPSGTAEKDKKVLLRAVRHIGQDGAAIMPEGMVIDFIEAKVSGNVDAFERLQRWMEQQISKGVLGQTETTDANKGGYATASVHDRVREDIRAADAKQLSATLTRDLVRPYVDLNFGPQETYPRARLALPASANIEALSKAVAPLIDRGLRVGAADMRHLLGLPEPDEGVEVLGPVAPTSPPPRPSAEPAPETASLALAAREIDDDDSIDSMLADELKDWRPLMEPLVDPIRALMDEVEAGGGSEEEKLLRVRDGLAGLIGDMDTAAIERLLEQAMFAARLAGETEAPLRDD